MLYINAETEAVVIDIRESILSDQRRGGAEEEEEEDDMEAVDETSDDSSSSATLSPAHLRPLPEIK